MERLFILSFQIELEFGVLVFCGGRKTGETRGKPSEQGQEPTTNSTHLLHRARIEPGPNWWGANTLITIPVPSWLPLIIN